MSANQSNGSIKFKVFRFDPDKDQQPYYDTFELETRPGMTVLEGLFDILERQDGSLAFRYSCREAICGSCALYINGAYRLACQTQVSHMDSDEVVVNPLPALQPVKDLVVDMTPFFEAYHAVDPYLQPAEDLKQVEEGKEYYQSPKDRKKLDMPVDCILCGSCYSSCPTTWTHEGYLGPAALLKAYRFVADSRDDATADRLSTVSTESGIWRCHTAYNCVEACPKDLNPTFGIQQLKKQTVGKLLFGSK